jgi:Rrf2 family protein
MHMRVSARVDYAVRALIQLAADETRMPVKAEHLATSQDIPPKFLLEILRQLKQKRLLVSRRGPEGGYVLARPAGEISIADVIRAVEGPLATVRDVSPANLAYEGPTESLPTVWLAVRGSLRQVLETVTLEDVRSGNLPKHVLTTASKYGVEERP